MQGTRGCRKFLREAHAVSCLSFEKQGTASRHFMPGTRKAPGFFVSGFPKGTKSLWGPNTFRDLVPLDFQSFQPEVSR